MYCKLENDLSRSEYEPVVTEINFLCFHMAESILTKRIPNTTLSKFLQIDKNGNERGLHLLRRNVLAHY